MVLDNGGDDFVSLREIIVHVDVPEPFRHTTPTINLLLRQFIDIVADFLMGDQHKMELEFTAPSTLLREVLQHLGVRHRCAYDIRFKELRELVIHDIALRTLPLLPVLLRLLRERL